MSAAVSAGKRAASKGGGSTRSVDRSCSGGAKGRGACETVGLGRLLVAERLGRDLPRQLPLERIDAPRLPAAHHAAASPLRCDPLGEPLLDGVLLRAQLGRLVDLRLLRLPPAGARVGQSTGVSGSPPLTAQGARRAARWGRAAAPVLSLSSRPPRGCGCTWLISLSILPQLERHRGGGGGACTCAAAAWPSIRSAPTHRSARAYSSGRARYKHRGMLA